MKTGRPFKNSKGGELGALLLAVIVVFLGHSHLALSQVLDQRPAQEVQSGEAEDLPADPLGRNSPRGTFAGYIEAVSRENYERAAEYLDLSHLPENRHESRGTELANILQDALDRGGSVPPFVVISDDPEGQRGDELDPDVDQIGTIRTEDGSIALLLERQAQGKTPVWLISSQTLRALPQTIGAAPLIIDRVLPAVLMENRWQGVPLGHWLAMLLLAAIAYLVSGLITAVVAMLARVVLARKAQDYGVGLIKAFALPVKLYLAVLLFIYFAQILGISIIVRQYFSQLTFIVTWAAILLLGWRLINLLGSVGEVRMSQRGNYGALSAMLFFRRTLKVALAAIGVFMILDTMGIDVTAGLAALGIGGLAVALGAQRTIENLVGSLTLIFDQPVRVGDFCKVDDTLGTIEEIGMRSTRIRTLDRTIVVIPNGDFSAQKIENYAHRDRFWYHPLLALRYETSPDQIRYLLVELRAILYAHPRVDPDPARVRFAGFGDSSLNLEVFAYVNASDFDDFLELKEDLNLRIADVVASSGTGFALPSRTLYVAQDTGLSEEKTKNAEGQVRQWRERNELQVPKFSEERVKDLQGTIDYPPKGSSSA